MGRPPFILTLETATLGGSICLARGTEILGAREGDARVSHSNSILTDINGCLNDAGVKLGEIELFACASGPGSFTGLRIGIATLKGLASTLARPCVGVPTLSAVALSAGASNLTVALLPAGRGEVFAQMFSVVNDEVVEVDTAAHLSPPKLLSRYQEFPKIRWAGPGAQLQKLLLQEHAAQHSIPFHERSTTAAPDEPAGWQIAPPATNLARYMSALALRLFVEGKLQTAETLHANYVRPSDAEINQACQ